MKQFKIIIDSSSDLPHEYALKHDLTVLPLKFSFDGNEYLDNTLDFASMSSDTFYKRLREGSHAKTAQVNIGEFYNAFKAILEQGHDILAVLLSAELSGTFNSASVAKEQLLEEFPERKIILVNSISGSLGIGLLIDEAVRLKEKNHTLEEIKESLEVFKHHIMCIFTHDDLSHLQAGGRIGKFSFWLGTALKIKPIISADDEGKLKPRHKVLGRKKSLKLLLDKVVELYDPTYSEKIFISHGDCLEETMKFVEELELRLNTKVNLINIMGPVIGAHGGPGTVAVFFTTKQR